MTACDLARWAADAFAGYDLAGTHRIVAATTGPGPLPDYVSARVDTATGTVGLPRPVGVVLARVAPGAPGGAAPVDEVVRRVLLTRNALLVEAVPAAPATDGTDPAGEWRTAVAGRVRHLAFLAEDAGAPAGVLQMYDGSGPVDLVLAPAIDAPVVVIVDAGARVGVEEPGAVVLTVGAGYTDLGHALRAARGILRESGGDRVRVHSDNPDGPLRVAAALPVTRVAVGDLDMPPSIPDHLVTWTRISGDRHTVRQPWVSPGGPVPAYPRASNESP